MLRMGVAATEPTGMVLPGAADNRELYCAKCRAEAGLITLRRQRIIAVSAGSAAALQLNKSVCCDQEVSRPSV